MLNSVVVSPRHNRAKISRPGMSKAGMNRLRSTRTEGFSLIEIMIVVVIIGILTGLVATVISGKDDQAKIVAVKSDLRVISNALDMYKLDNHRYPSTDEGVQALVTKPADAPNWNPQGYVKSVPRDPWNRVYVYQSPGLNGPYDLGSLGADGQEGGEGVNADIYLSEL